MQTIERKTLAEECNELIKVPDCRIVLDGGRVLQVCEWHPHAKPDSYGMGVTIEGIVVKSGSVADRHYTNQQPASTIAVGDTVNRSDGTALEVTADMLNELYGKLKSGALFWDDDNGWIMED